MSFIYVPFSYLMKGCLWLAGDRYVIALLFFALAMQVIMIPLYIKQQKSQIQAAKVRPMEMAIREKYKGRTDRATMQKMNGEIQEMYQKSGYNQFSGCLPMLITLPLILILYAIVRQPISYASNLTKNNSEFLEQYSKSAVEFYQSEKEALIRQGYESDDAYNKAVKEIDTLQSMLGGTVRKEKNGEGKEVEATTASGLKIYDFKSVSSSGDLYLTKLIINGEEDLDKMIAQGQIPASVKEDYVARGFGEYADDLPDFNVFGISLLNTPDFKANAWLFIVPVLVFLTQFLAMKLNRKFVPAVPGPNGKPVGGGLFMEVGMPLLSAYFAFRWPAAMGVYWIWRTLLDMIKSFVFYKVMPIPKVTQEQIDAAKKELKGSASSKKKKRITIEVDEDDDSYDGLVVSGREGQAMTGSEADLRPRRVEMLSMNDDDEQTLSEAKKPAEDVADGGEQEERQ